MRRRVAALVAMVVLLAQGAAADTALQSMATGDESRGWEAVGRLNLGDRGFCTAALIAPDVVLTAAHCLYDKTTGQRFPIDKMQFLADWRLGRAAAYRGIRRAVQADGYSYAEANRVTQMGHDLALLQLDQPIRLPSIQPFAVATGDLQAGDRVAVVSYAQDRADAPSLQQTCGVEGTRPGVLIMSCSIDFGSSGAPVFVLRNGVPAIVSVISAMADAGGRRVSLGVDLAGVLAPLQARLTAAMNGTLVETVPVQGGGGLPTETGTGGAKFLRP